MIGPRGMDPAQDAIVQFIQHKLHYPNGGTGSDAKQRLPLRSQWRLNAELADESTKWLYWLARGKGWTDDLKFKLPPGRSFCV